MAASWAAFRGLTTVGRAMGTQMGLTGASVACTGPALIPEQGTRAPLQTEFQEGAHLPGLTQSTAGGARSCGLQRGQCGRRAPHCWNATLPWHDQPRPWPRLRVLTWVAGPAIVSQREAGEAGTAVRAHSVETKVLAQLPWEQQALILVVAGQAVGQFGLCAQGQGLPAPQLRL